MARFFHSRRAVAVATLVCIALLLVSVNVIAGRYADARLDLTAEHLYTLSPGTRHALSRIDEPITLRLYYSSRLGDEIPSYGVYEQRVRELLNQYVAAAHGKLRLEVFDPEPFSAAEDRAVAFGLQAVPLDVQGEKVYFGLAGTNSTDDQQVIPFFNPSRERFLEYDLTKLVHALAVPKKTVVGLMTTLPLQGDMMAMLHGRRTHPMAIMDELGQLYTIKQVGVSATAIPPDVDVLMLVHPQHLPAPTLYAIDQFVLRGGKALVFVDPYSELQANHPDEAHPTQASDASDLNRLFKSWGITVPKDKVVGDREAAQRVSVPSIDGGRPVNYVAWLGLKAGNLNHNDMITGALSHLTMATAGIIEPQKGAKTRVEPLITTSRDAMTIPIDKIRGIPDVASLLANFKPTDQRYILAARITGPVATAFPDGPPKPPPAKPGAKPAATKPPVTAKPLTHSLHPINVVVVADTDILADRFWVEHRSFFGRQIMVPFANNGDFVADTIESLAGGQDLIGLRSRGTSARPFVVVDRLQHQAEARYSAEQKSLQQKLQATQAKLQDLVGGDTHAAADALSPAQTRAITQFRSDLLQTRRELRDVQRALRSNIERLKGLLEFINIALIPIVVAVLAIILGTLRLRRRGRRSAHA